MAEIIESLMAMPRLERGRIGQENRRIVESSFSLERMHERYERVYAALAN